MSIRFVRELNRPSGRWLYLRNPCHSEHDLRFPALVFWYLLEGEVEYEVNGNAIDTLVKACLRFRSSASMSSSMPFSPEQTPVIHRLRHPLAPQTFHIARVAQMPILVFLQCLRFALYLIVFPVLRRIHCGIGLFCFWARASFCFVRKDLWLWSFVTRSIVSIRRLLFSGLFAWGIAG